MWFIYGHFICIRTKINKSNKCEVVLIILAQNIHGLISEYRTCVKCWLNMIYVHLHQGYGLSVVGVVHAFMPSAK